MQKILIVDDNENNVSMLKKILSKSVNDCEIVTITDSTKAIEESIKNNINLILLDIQMPVMDGFDVAFNLKAESKTKDIPIIFITSFPATDELIEKAFAVGGIDFINRSIESKLLINKIKTYLDLFYRREINLPVTQKPNKDDKLYLNNQNEVTIPKNDNFNIRINKANKLRNNFIVKKSKRVTNFLSNINNIIDSMMDGALGPLNDPQNYNLSLIVNIINQIYDEMNSTYEYFRLYDDNFKLQKKSINMKALIDVVIVKSKKFLAEKSIIIHNEIETNMPYIFGNENNLEHILLKLFKVSMSFMRSGIINISALKKKAMIEFKISINGLIIPDDLKNAMFKTFEQINKTINFDNIKNFIDFSLIYKTIELHGGNIKYIPESDTVSNFIFHLPIGKDSNIVKKYNENIIKKKIYKTRIESNSKIITHNIKENKQAVILIIDNDIIEQQILINYLLINNYNIICAQTGKEAFNILEEGQKVDLILLSIVLPEITGFDVCSILRNKYSISDLPILMIAEKDETEDIITALKAGANDFIFKPFNKKEILVRIKTILKLKESINEIKRLNELLEQRVIERTNELEIMNKELEAFSYRVSHDLMSPIHVIENCEFILMRALKNRVNEETIKTVEYIGKNTRRMKKLINKLLMLSNIIRSNLKITNFNISKIVKDVLEMYMTLEPERNVEINIKENVYITGDKELIQIAISNLIDNAWKYTKKCNIAKIEFGTRKKDKETVYYITDNGIGFDMESVGKIFKAFERLHKIKDFSGSGIGLSTVHRIIKKHHGKIWTESKKNKGTTFLFVLNIR